MEVKQGQTTVASMTYDFLGRRTSLATAEGTTFFHYSGESLVAESDESGDVIATYAYTPQGVLMSMTRGQDTYYYQTNGHGDVVSVTDESGAVVNTYRYDPWGKPLSSTGTVPNPFRYAGYYYDESTDLYYLWHRYYDPELGRFTTPDPADAPLTRPNSLNAYAYCEDNPLAYSDHSGLWLDTILDIGQIGYDIYGTAKEGRKNLGKNLLYLGLDAGCALIPGITGGGAAAKGFEDVARFCDNYYGAINALGDAIDAGKSGGSLRRNLIRATGGAVHGSHAHHIFPKKFADFFVEKGISINDAKYGEWWRAYDHLKNAYGFNKQWEKWIIEHRNASLEQILEYGKKLMKGYGFDVNF